MKMEPETPDLTTRTVQIFKALADSTRLRILGALAEQPRTGKELSEFLGVGAPTVSHHMAKLTDAGLVYAVRDGQRHTYYLNEGALRDLVPLRPTPAPAQYAEADPDDKVAQEKQRIVRNFFDGPRLRQIPAQRRPRVVVLQHLMRGFEPGREYAEREVNDILRVAHDDYVTLRRELIDYGFLKREGGVYWVARSLPERGATVAQEIAGDERAWLRRLLADRTKEAT
jgi:hypothetical protein